VILLLAHILTRNTAHSPQAQCVVRDAHINTHVTYTHQHTNVLYVTHIKTHTVTHTCHTHTSTPVPSSPSGNAWSDAHKNTHSHTRDIHSQSHQCIIRDAHKSTQSHTCDIRTRTQAHLYHTIRQAPWGTRRMLDSRTGACGRNDNASGINAPDLGCSCLQGTAIGTVIWDAAACKEQQ